jgi:hypothetical protein
MNGRIGQAAARGKRDGGRALANLPGGNGIKPGQFASPSQGRGESLIDKGLPLSAAYFRGSAWYLIC